MTELDFAFTMRDELLMILAQKWNAHKMKKAEKDAADWPYVICIESPEGELYYHIAEERIHYFKDLPWRENHFDGSGPEQRTKRIFQLVERWT